MIMFFFSYLGYGYKGEEPQRFIEDRIKKNNQYSSVHLVIKVNDLGYDLRLCFFFGEIIDLFQECGIHTVPAVSFFGGFICDILLLLVFKC